MAVVRGCCERPAGTSEAPVDLPVEAKRSESKSDEVSNSMHQQVEAPGQDDIQPLQVERCVGCEREKAYLSA